MEWEALNYLKSLFEAEGAAAGSASAMPGMSGMYDSIAPASTEFSMAEGASPSVFTGSPPVAPEKSWLQRFGDGMSGGFGDMAKAGQDGNYAGVAGKVFSEVKDRPGMSPMQAPQLPGGQMSPLAQVYMKYGSRGPYGSYGGY